MLIIKIEAGNRVPGARLGGLFLECLGLASTVKTDYPVALRILDRVRKHRRPGFQPSGTLDGTRELMAVKDIVPEEQRARAVTDEL